MSFRGVKRVVSACHEGSMESGEEGRTPFLDSFKPFLAARPAATALHFSALAEDLPSFPL